MYIPAAIGTIFLCSAGFTAGFGKKEDLPNAQVCALIGIGWILLAILSK